MIFPWRPDGRKGLARQTARRRHGVSLGVSRIACVLGLLGAVLCPVPSAQAQQHALFIIPSMPGSGFRVDMGTMLDRRFYTVIRQRYDFSCGSAALATLLHYHYGIPANEEMTFTGMWDKGDQEAIRKGGFSLLDMKRYLGSHGLETQGFRVTLDQVAKTRVPGIALTVTKGYRHFVVIKGVTEREVLVGDPSRGLVRYSHKEFGKIWDGLYFVITSSREVGQSSFNRLAQWTSVGRAPIGTMLSRPVEPETVRLGIPAPMLGEL